MICYGFDGFLVVLFRGGFRGGADVFCGGARGGFWW